MIEKCEEKFLSEIDIGTMIKRLRTSYNSLDDLKEKDLKEYLKLNRANIIISDDDSDDQNHDFAVEKGYFSSSSGEDPDEVIKV